MKAVPEKEGAGAVSLRVIDDDDLRVYAKIYDTRVQTSSLFLPVGGRR